jgi:outer membrane lipoprotein-sorting protein
MQLFAWSSVVRRCANGAAIFAAVMSSAALAGPATAADPPSADEIVRQMKAALEPPRPSARSMKLIVHDVGEKTEFGLVQARKKMADGSRSLTVLREPDDARGIAYLIAEKPGEPDNVEWLYVPVVRRVRKLVPAENYTSFMESDFTYADLGFLPTDYKNELLGTEQLEGKKTYKVQSIPGSTAKQWYYSRIVTWVDAETLLPLKREFVSPSGTVFKRETFSEVTRIDGIPTPLKVKMENLPAKSSTDLVVTDVTYDTQMPDSLFDPSNLQTIAEAAFWKDRQKAKSAPPAQ